MPKMTTISTPYSVHHRRCPGHPWPEIISSSEISSYSLYSRKRSTFNHNFGFNSQTQNLTPFCFPISSQTFKPRYESVCWFSPSPSTKINPYILEIGYPYEEYHQLLMEQQHIGSDNFLSGMISNQWRIYQYNYEQTQHHHQRILKRLRELQNPSLLKKKGKKEETF